MSRLVNKVALVTGGASGIGRAVVEVFAENGASVAILDKDADAGVRTAEEITDRAGPVIFVHADISDERTVEQAVKEVVSELGGLHILVNNASHFIIKGLDATPEEWQIMMAVNIMGPALVTKHAAARMRLVGGGSVVNVSSVAGFIGERGCLTYSATKAAVVEMTRCMAVDLIDGGIRVNSVSPGVVWTPQVERLVKERGWTREYAVTQPYYGAEQLLRRMAEPCEIASAVLFLASDDASFITGTNLMVDGGWTSTCSRTDFIGPPHDQG